MGQQLPHSGPASTFLSPQPTLPPTDRVGPLRQAPSRTDRARPFSRPRSFSLPGASRLRIHTAIVGRHRQPRVLPVRERRRAPRDRGEALGYARATYEVLRGLAMHNRGPWAQASSPGSPTTSPAPPLMVRSTS